MHKFDRHTALAQWFYYQTYGADKKINNQQKLHYLRLLLSCASADGKVSEGEMNYFIGAALARGCTDEMITSLINAPLVSDLSFEANEFIQANPAAKMSDLLSLLYSAMQVCAADGVYAEEEVNAIRKLSVKLGVSAQDLIKVEDFFTKELALKKEAHSLFVG
ncbi:TerB family tellurite resistance protein [Pseudomonas marginalis]|uniref:TerB family tellurite resistance protein n=1 Tax=Pseudomonas marginalis TaxID=298 RepID=UPI003BA0E0E5